MRQIVPRFGSRSGQPSRRYTDPVIYAQTEDLVIKLAGLMPISTIQSGINLGKTLPIFAIFEIAFSRSSDFVDTINCPVWVLKCLYRVP